MDEHPKGALTFMLIYLVFITFMCGLVYTGPQCTSLCRGALGS
jgi:hypothetical protein